jgi:hypothetical protein
MHCFKLFIQAYRHSSPKFTSPSFPSPPLKELAVLSMTKTYDQLENRREIRIQGTSDAQRLNAQKFHLKCISEFISTTRLYICLS